MAIKGFNKVKANLKKFQRVVLSGAEKSLEMQMELIITEAKILCPVDTGTLRSSGRADSKKTLSKVEVEGSFGNGPSGKYALYVHEGVGTKSGRSGGMNINYKVGQPKFLEQPFKQRAGGSLLFTKVGHEVSVYISSKFKATA